MRTRTTLLATFLVVRSHAQFGSLDAGFNPQDVVGGKGDGLQLHQGRIPVLETDSTILLFGAEDGSYYNGVRAPNLMRIGLNGERDGSFPGGTGTDGSIVDVAVQTDGRILVAGYFSTYNGAPVESLIRLNQDGSLDDTFEFDPLFAVEFVNAIDLQPDGRIVASGSSTVLSPPTWVKRLNPDGSFDPSFEDVGDLFINHLRALEVMPDGDVLLCGDLQANGVQTGRHIARLNGDGTYDSAFISGTGFDAPLDGAVVDSNGLITVVGSFSAYNGTPISRLAQLMPNGALVAGFGFATAPAGSSGFRSITSLADGGFVINCDPEQFHGPFPANGLFKVDDSGVTVPFLQSFSLDGSTYGTIELSNGDLVTCGAFRRFVGTRVVLQGGIFKVDAAGSLDLEFNSNTGADDEVEVVVGTADGGAFIGGAFTRYNGDLRQGIARINADGSLAPDLSGHGIDLIYPYLGDELRIKAIAPLPDGRLLVGGMFRRYDGLPRLNLARLLSDGSLDMTFDPDMEGMAVGVNAVLPLEDGKVIVAGYDYGSVVAPGLRRLLPNGALDPDYHNGFPATCQVDAVCMLASGHLLVGGRSITEHDGSPGGNLLKLDANGYRDPDFVADVQPGYQNSGVFAIAKHTDGRIAIAGDFTHVNGYARQNIAVIDENGELDLSFDPGTGFSTPPFLFSGDATGVAWMPDGRLLVTGTFTEYDGTQCGGIARINADGSLDATLDVGSGQQHYFSGNIARAIGLLSDESVLIGGQFTHCGGAGRNRLLKLMPDDLVSVRSGAGGSELSIYPNPTTGSVRLDNLPVGSEVIMLYDGAGKLISEQRLNAKADPGAVLDLTDHAPGSYLLVVGDPHGTSAHLLQKTQ